MARDIYSQIYKKIDLLTGGILNFISSPEGYLKLKSTGYMDLIIERLGHDTVSIAHYYEQNGDLVADPEITVKIDFDNCTAEALTFQNFMGFYTVYPEADKVNLKLKKTLNSFLNYWLTNLKEQGFYQ